MRQDVLAAYASNVKRRKRRRGDLFDPATKAFLDRVSADLPLKRQQNLDLFFRGLRATGMLDSSDAIYDFTGLSQQEMCLNLVQDAYNLTVGLGTVNFVARSHVAGDGTDDYLDTNFNPLTAVNPKFVQDSAHMGVFPLDDTDNAGARDDLMGSLNSFIARTAAVPGGITYRMNRATSSTATGATIPGHIVCRRTSSSATTLFVNGAQIGTVSAASAAPTNATFKLLNAGGSGESINRLRFAHFGRLLFSTGAQSMLRIAQVFQEHASRRLDI